MTEIVNRLRKGGLVGLIAGDVTREQSAAFGVTAALLFVPVYHVAGIGAALGGAVAYGILWGVVLRLRGSRGTVAGHNDGEP